MTKVEIWLPHVSKCAILHNEVKVIHAVTTTSDHVYISHLRGMPRRKLHITNKHSNWLITASKATAFVLNAAIS